jgi:hypothetical protein
MRSMRPDAITSPLNCYEVVKPIEGINSGLTAPFYGQRLGYSINFRGRFSITLIMDTFVLFPAGE